VTVKIMSGDRRSCEQIWQRDMSRSMHNRINLNKQYRQSRSRVLGLTEAHTTSWCEMVWDGVGWCEQGVGYCGRGLPEAHTFPW
jgi:hypothetical protein